VLVRLLEAIGGERVFLVRLDRHGSAGSSLRVETTVCLRPDRQAVPSRSVLRQTTADRRVSIVPDASSSLALADGESVKALHLRWVAGAPVPRASGAPFFLVIDSRAERNGRLPALEDLIAGFAGLVGLVLREPPRGLRPGACAPTEPPPVTIVGRSLPLRRLLDAARRVASWKVPVLVTGESGSGKELVARLLHQESLRRDGPFVAANCAAIPEALLEAEIFGARRGAYTGLDRDRPGLIRRAHRGTLLLDEVGDMPPFMQARLLRVLQESRVLPLGDDVEHRVDVRVIAATHRDLAELTRENRFRADLFYRLAVVQLHVPALRERREDIPLLARHLIEKLARETGQESARLSEEAIDRLRRQDWPGNVRELEAAIARGILRAGGGEIFPRHLDLSTPPAAAGPDSERPLEHEMIETALRESGGNVTQAARRIGWSRQKLSRKMAVMGVSKPPRRFP
jgi:transcriptional regulator with AAA-type ATPase domain